MKNLKRVLCLALVVAMMMSVMVLGTGAAFTDSSDIENTEAVDMNVALNVINGLPDGSFNPTGNVTRAEMCKMICIVLNGGRTPSTGVKATPTFSDIDGNWAEAYIEYCAALGIVAGVGDGTFNPTGNVTGTQAAKMLLICLGYDATYEEFTGANWATMTDVRANQKDLYNGLDIDTSAALSREDAAQMIWNALQATMVDYDYSLTTVNGELQNIQNLNDTDTTLLYAKFKAYDDFEGTLVAYTWDSTDEDYEYTFLVTDTTSDYYDSDTDNTYTYTSTVDYTGLFGLNVKVVYKNNTDQDVYGIFASDSCILASGVMNDLATYDSDTIKFKSVKYDTDAKVARADLPVVAENQWPTSSGDYTATIADKYGDDWDAVTDGTQALPGYYEAKLVDSDNDGKANFVIYLPYTVAQVTSVGTTSVGLDEDPYTLKFADDDIYDGIATDDYVKVVDGQYTANSDEYTVTQMSTLSGTVTGTKTAGDIQIDGTWYKNGNSVSVSLDSEYTFYVVGTYVFYASQVSGSNMDNLLFVAQTTSDTISNKAKVYFTDGTSAIVTIEEVDNDSGTDVTDKVVFNGGSLTGDEFYLTNQMYTYTVSNGEYTLTALGDGNDLGYTYAGLDGTSLTMYKANSNANDKLYVDGASYAFADDAVVFIKYDITSTTSFKVKVVTGTVAQDYDAVGVANAIVVDEASGLTKTVSGVASLKAAALVLNSGETTLPSSSGETGNYGYVVGSTWTTKIDGDTYTAVKFWDGSDTVTKYFSDNADVDVGALTTGAVISYTDLGDNEISDVTVEGNLSTALAVTGIDGDTLTVSDGSTSTDYYLTDDTEYLYVDTDTDVGSDSGAVVLASKETSGYVMNVVIVPGSDSEIDLIVVDINNEWK